MKLRLIFLFMFLGVLKLPAQNYMWWNTIHNWDGITSWYHYLTFSSAYLGANALPVPEIRDAQISPKLTFSQDFVIHKMTGDLTLNLENKLHIPLAKNVALQFFIVPVEYYNTDTIVRDERAAREYSGQGFAAGDLNITTLVQLCKESEKHPAILLAINLRTASGGKMLSARYTDAPGYNFDLSTSKTMTLNNSIKLKIYGQLGFYVWQLNRVDYQQDDAFEYGFGLDFKYKDWLFKNQLGGYSGYLNIGDKPIIQRFIVQTNFKKKINYHLKLQKAWRDYDYSSCWFGIVLNLSNF